MTDRRKVLGSAALFLMMFVVGTALRSPSQPPPYTAMALPDSTKDYLLFVYISKASCPVCQRETVKSAVRSAMSAVARHAQDNGLGFHAVGVGLDSQAQASVEHLEEVGPFTEITAGGNWIGLGAIRFLWEGYGPPTSTPQVLVARRRISVQRIPPVTRNYWVDDSELLLRKSGEYALRAWVSGGALVPGLAKFARK